MASKEIKGIVIQIEGKNDGLVKSLKEVETQLKKDDDALKRLEKALKLDPKNVDLLAAKEAVLADKTQQTASKMEILQQVQKDALSDLPEDAELSASQMAELQTEIANTEESLDELKKSDSAFQKLKDGASSAKESLDKVGDVGEKIGSGIKKGAEVAIKALAALGAAAATATVAAVGAISKSVFDLGKQVVTQFADYEQALGGSEAVFGEYAKTIQNAAQESWRTMGTTEEQFLASANKVGALFQGTGVSVERSAELTSQAMTRAADMASVMGIDTQSALDAITGAAKGNYTMMDNLGIKMDKTTLEAYAMAKGFKTAWKDMSGAEQAEVAMQYFFENTEKYAGNFEREATETISGSIGMLKSSWSNLITSLGSGEADIAQYAQNVVTSFDAVAKNITPILENFAQNLPTMIESLMGSLEPMMGPLLDSVLGILSSLLEGIAQLLPQIASHISTLIETIAETIMSNQEGLSQSISTILDTLVRSIVGLLPTLIPIALQALETLANALLDNIDIIIDGAVQIVMGLVNGLLAGDTLSRLVDAAITLITKLAEALFDEKSMNQIIQGAVKLVTTLTTNLTKNLPKFMPKVVDGLCKALELLTQPEVLSQLIEGALQLALALVDGLVQSMPRIGQAVIQIIANIVTTLIAKAPEILQTCIELIGGLLTSLGTFVLGLLGMSFEDIFSSFDEVFEFIGQWFSGVFESVGQFFADIGTNLGTFITDTVQSIVDFFSGIGETIGGFITSAIESIGSFFASIGETVGGALSSIIEAVGSFFGNIIEGIVSNVENILGSITGLVSDITSSFTGLVSDAFSWGADMISNIIDGIGSMLESLWDTVTDIAGGIADFLGFSVPEEGPLSEWAQNNPGKDMIQLFIDGIENAEQPLLQKVENISTDINEGFADGLKKLAKIVDIVATFIQDKFSGLEDAAYKWGVSLMDSFIRGFDSKVGALKKAVAQAAGIVSDQLHFSTPKEGPLSDFDKSGGDMMDVFIKGMESREGALKSAVSRVADNVSELKNPMTETEDNSGTQIVIPDYSNSLNQITQLLALIAQNSDSQNPIHVTIDVGQTRFAELVAQANAQNAYISGGY